MSYLNHRKAYKGLIRSKKKTYCKSSAQKINDSLGDSNTFWRQLRNLNSQSRINNTISLDDWHTYFSSLFNPVTHDDAHNTDEPSLNDLLSNINYHLDPTKSVNNEITEEEISKSIKCLKSNKSARPDGFVSEMFKYSPSCLTKYLVKLFNAIYDTGVFPAAWRRSTIVPIHKKGGVNLPENYRGISLTSVFSKIFTGVLNKRPQTWASDNFLISEEQAGFRKGYATVDNVFILHSLIRDCLDRKRKLYVAFIDYKKAFDSINRNALWKILEQNGIDGKMLDVLKSIYSEVVSCVRSDIGTTKYFNCSKGLKQGCILSPILFSYIIQVVTNEVCRRGGHGTQLHPDIIELSILLFADDIVLIADTVYGLQRKINVLYNVSCILGLEVHAGKSNIVVFRNGDKLAANEKWHIGTADLNVVSEYTYLGIVMSTRLSSTCIQNRLATRARSAVAKIDKSLRHLHDLELEVLTNIFDTQVKPILLYGAEVWGMCNDTSVIENVHLNALKRSLNVPFITPNALVYGDTGRHELYIRSTICSIRYWLKILKMNDSRYVKKVYNMMLNRSTANSWTNQIKDVLYNLNLSEYWENQLVENERNSLHIVESKLIEISDNKWSACIARSNRYSVYRTFKLYRFKEDYLKIIHTRKLRKLVTCFRLGVSDIFDIAIDLITTHNLYVHSALSMKKMRCTLYYNVLCFIIYD